MAKVGRMTIYEMDNEKKKNREQSSALATDGEILGTVS